MNSRTKARHPATTSEAGIAVQPESDTTDSLAVRFQRTRDQTRALVAPLSAEDAQAQSMPDASPAKWHLAHVTWFFETFVLEPFEPDFKPHHPSYRMLFNSYYNAIGRDRHPRPERGLLTRPTLDEVLQWRTAVEARVHRLLAVKQAVPEIAQRTELGIQHEQQHQELLLTDCKHLLSRNPLQPVYQPTWPLAAVAPVAINWVDLPGGRVDIGHGAPGFAFDNETPRHAHWLAPYALSNRLVTHGDWLAFVAAGGYEDPRWWLSAGWDWVQAQGIRAPLYWRREEGAAGRETGWHNFTLHGLVPVDPHTPVVHVSYFEADAYARWVGETHSAMAGARLPTEFEWESAAAACSRAGNFLESQALHPMPVAKVAPGVLQMFGDVWEWTSSSYAPYPGYRPWTGNAGEYNGKFMVNQYVLRGGSCATPASHIRASYRNFFPSDARWQFSGLRLARTLD